MGLENVDYTRTYWFLVETKENPGPDYEYFHLYRFKPPTEEYGASQLVLFGSEVYARSIGAETDQASVRVKLSMRLEPRTLPDTASMANMLERVQRDVHHVTISIDPDDRPGTTIPIELAIIGFRGA